MRMKTGFAKQLLSILLCVTMLLTYVPTAAFAAEGTADSATLYLVPNEWTSDNAGLAVYYWTGTGNNWVKMEKVQDNLYKTVTPIPTSGLSGVIFVRHNSAQEPSWDSKRNQTADLTFSGTQNTATIPAGGWDGTAVTWSHTHLGGTATCSEKAVCESCGEGYGDLNSDNHIYDAEGKCDCGLVCSHSSANTSDYTCTTCGNRLAAKWEKYTSSTLRGYKYYLTLDAVELTDTSSQDMFIILNDSVLTGTLNIGSCTFSNVNGATLTIQGDSLLSSKNSTGSYDWILCEASSMGAAGTQSFGSVETLLNNGLSVFLRQDKTVGNLSVNVFFKVPAGRTLTVNGTLTLGESAILQIVGTLAFGEAGRIVNSGTVQLPEGTSYAEIPAAITGGIVKIGTASYTWDNDQAKWICDESSHVGGIATCKERAHCSLCKQVYGYTDSTNHASTELTYTDNGDGTHLKAHACCGLSVNSRETHFLDSTTGKCACGYEMARAKVTSGGVDTYHETLSAALAAAVSGDTVSLCADVDIKTTSHTIPEGVTFSGGEYTISGEGAGWVYNNGIITDGKFTFFVDNRGTIKGGEFFSVSNSGAVMGGSFQGVDCKSGSSISGPVRISDLTYIEECSINLSEAYLTSGVRIVSANAQELPVSSLHLPEGYALQVDDSIVSVLPPWLYGFVVEHAHTYEKEEFDTSNHWMVCACGAATEKLGHSYTYAPNGENHTVGCAGCGYTGTGDHTVQSEATCIAKAVCKFCGEYGGKDATNHADTAPYDNGFCLGCDVCEPAVDSDNDGYYEISNAGQLYWFAQQVNAGNNAINGKLMKDIVVNAGTMTAETTGAREWIPISKDYSNGYSGTFEGNNKTISGLYLNNNELTHAGLFGHIDTDGKVQNVGVINSYIKDSNSLAYVGGISSYNHGAVLNCYNTGRVIGNLRGGGVVGYNAGTVTDCYNEGDVSGTSSIGGVAGSNHGTVTDCYNKGSINGSQAGGVVGNNTGDVTNCYNTGDVSSTGNNVGGVAGTNDGDVTNCYNTGTVNGTSNIGGVAGSNTSTVTNCYNIGTVSGTSNIGGVVGLHEGSVTSCYNIGTVSGTSNIGGVAGVNDGTVRGCYYLVGCGGTGYGNSRKEEAFKSGEVAYLLGEAFGQTISSQDYPVLGGQKVYYGYTFCGDSEKIYTNDSGATDTKPGHTPDENGYTSDTDMHTFICSTCGAEVIEAHSTTAGGDSAADCNSKAYCSVCESYYGEVDKTKHDETVAYDSNGFCPNGCDDYEPATQVTEGNYGELGLSADHVGYYAISNAGQLYWFAEQIRGSNQSINAILIADIVVNQGTMTEGNTAARRWIRTGEYTGTFDGDGHTISGLYISSLSDYIGLFGHLGIGGKVSNVGIINSYMYGYKFVGGVVGYNRGTVTNCYNSGIVKSNDIDLGGVVGRNLGTVQNCYNTGTVSGADSNVGGVVGKNYSTVQNCYNTGTVRGSFVGGVVGYNEENSTVKNCYNSGNVTGRGTYVGGVVGYYHNYTVTNSYYLDTSCSLSGGGTKKTVDEFKSGEVAYLLNGSTSEGIWKQTIGEDEAPNFTGNTVYQVKNCKDEPAYSNTTDNIGHQWNNGVCSVCEEACSHTLTCSAEDDVITVSCSVGCGYSGTATISATGKTYDGNGVEVEVSKTGSLENTDISVTLTKDGAAFTGEPVNAGTYTASITLGEGEAAATASVEYTIEKKELTAIVSGSMSKSYDGTNVVPEGHSLKIVLDGVISGDTVTASADFAFAGINAGTTTINATNIALSGKDAENYKLKETEVSANVGEIVPLDFNYLEPHDYEIVFGAEPIVYNGKEQAMTVESFVMCGMDVTYELNGNTGTEAGFYTMTVTATGNFAGTVTQGWQISKKAVTVTAKDQTITYGSTISDTEFTSAGLADGHSVTVTLMPSTANVTADGTITASAAVIAAGSTDVTANYEITYAGGKLVIEPDTSKIAGLTTENVTSANETDIKEVQEMLENADSVKDEWNAVTATCEDLLAKIGAAADATDTENTGKVENVTAENVKPENKEALEDAKADLEKALEANGGNYTESEKKTIQEQIDRIEAAVAALENVEKLTESIGVLPESVETDDEAAAEKILSVKEAYDALTDHEKSLVDEDVKKKLDALVAVLTAYDIIEGDGSSWTQGSNGTVSFTANGAFSKFVGIKVDGKAVDKANFEAKSGSTVITLKASYLATLAVGEHTLTVVYTNGSTDGTFKIAARAITPPTGDSSNIMLFGSMLTISLAGLIVLLWAARKRKPENA